MEMLSNRAAPGYTRLSGIWNAASVTEKLNFKCYLILIHVEFKKPFAASGYSVG